MKKYSKVVAVLGVLALVALGVLVQGNQVTVPYKPGVTPSSVVKTYANSQVDTVTWAREGGVSALAFGAEWKDSVSLTSVQVVRLVNGKQFRTNGTVARDSVVEFRTYQNLANTANPDSACVGVVQLYPIADSYQFIVTYAGSGNGVTNPTVVYELIKQYSK